MSYKSVNLNDYEVVTNAQSYLKGALPGVIEASQERFAHMKTYVEEGDWTLRLAGLTAGIAIVFTSAIGFLSDLTSLSPFYSVLDVYLFAFGIVMIALEYKNKLFPVIYLQALRREALFLYKPYGRAGFYLLAGILLVVKGGFLGWLCGLFSVFVGGFSFYVSRAAYQAMEKLRQNMLEESDVVRKFNEADTNGDGHLDISEVKALCSSLGMNLNRYELESAFFMLDRDGNGDVSLEEFQYWFSHRLDV